MLTAGTLIGSVQVLQVLHWPTSCVGVAHAAQRCLHRDITSYSNQRWDAHSVSSPERYMHIASMSHQSMAEASGGLSGVHNRGGRIKALACALDRAAWVPLEKGCKVGRLPSCVASAGTGAVPFSRTPSSATCIPCSCCAGVCSHNSIRHSQCLCYFRVALTAYCSGCSKC